MAEVMNDSVSTRAMWWRVLNGGLAGLVLFTAMFIVSTLWRPGWGYPENRYVLVGDRPAVVTRGLVQTRLFVDSNSAEPWGVFKQGVERGRLGRLVDAEDHRPHLIVTAGWPWRMAWAEMKGLDTWWDRFADSREVAAIRAHRIEGGLSAPLSVAESTKETGVMPLRPLWPGVIGNLLAWIAISEGICWLWSAVTRLRAAWRQRQGRCPRCKYELARGESVRCPECGWSHMAPYRGRRSWRRPAIALVVIFLIGGSIWLVDGVLHRETALAEAIRAGDAAGVTSVLQRLSDQERAAQLAESCVSSADVPPLMLAARLGRADVVRTLLEAGAEVDARNASDLAPLAYGVASLDLDVVRTLLESGADPNGLYEGGASTPLFFAASALDAGVIRLLVEFGADPEDDRCEKKPLLKLMFAGVRDQDVIQALVDGGADPNRPIGPRAGTTLLMASILSESLLAAQGLIAAGADVNAVDNYGSTALMEACDAYDVAFVRMLLEAGADVSMRDVDGMTARDYALEIDVVEVREQILALLDGRDASG